MRVLKLKIRGRTRIDDPTQHADWTPGENRFRHGYEIQPVNNS